MARTRIRDADRKLLWGRSGNECAFPQCSQSLTMTPEGAEADSRSSTPVVLGEEAHIVAAEDDGPRGDPSMPIGERNAYRNLILLCPTHHRLIDKDNGIHYSVAELHKMKADHERLVERRRIGVSDRQEQLQFRRSQLLLEAISASRGRLIASWVALGISPELAQSLADDESIGAPARLGRALPQTGLVVLEGDFGSGKTATGERIFGADAAAALDDGNAPIPIYLVAKSVAGPLADAVRTAAEGLGRTQDVGLRLVLDGFDEPGPARATELLNDARALVFTLPKTRVVATARPGLDLHREERLPYPPLSDDEAAALAERLGDNRFPLWSRSEAIRKMLHLPLFLIVAVLRQQAGAEIPRSQGTFLEALADAALRRGHQPTGEVRQALTSLARLTVGSGGVVAAAELGGDAVRTVFESRLVVRDGRSLRFALPVVEQYFAAQAVLDAGLAGIDLHDLRQLDGWRDSLTLAVTIGSWQQVSTLLDSLAPVHPGLASWLVVNAVPESATVTSTELPSHLECANRLHHALARWINGLGVVGQRLQLTDNRGMVRTLGAFVEGNRITAGLRMGYSGGVDAVQLPYGLHPFTGRATDGSQWAPLRWGHAPADFMAWPWQWMLEWVSQSIEAVLRTTSLPLPNTKSFQDERRWAMAKAILHRTGSIGHKPIDANELRIAAEQLLGAMVGQGAQFFKLNPHRRLVVTKDEIAGLIEKLKAHELTGNDGMLHRPYPAPDIANPQGGHVSNVYSDEALRTLVEQVYASALIIYSDLVATWFSSFASTLGLACIMPVAFQGQLLPRGGSWGDPDFVYRMTPLPPNEPSASTVRLVKKREDLNIDWEAMIEEGRRLRQLISVLHPGAEGWANPRSADATLDVYGDTPGTMQAYQWLWEDLRALHMVKSPPPVGENW